MQKVIEYIDINDPRLLVCTRTVPMWSDIDKTLCCLCCESGPLTLYASVDRVGYCPGESVIISVTAENLTGRVLQGIRAQLISETRRFASGRRSCISQVICKTMGEPILAGETGMWVSKLFPLPFRPARLFNEPIIYKYP